MTAIDAGRAASLESYRAAILEKLNQPRCVAKSDWRAMPAEELLAFLEGEVVELSGAIERLRIVQEQGTDDAKRRLIPLALEGIAGETVDVAAFSFFIFDIVTLMAWQLGVDLNQIRHDLDRAEQIREQAARETAAGLHP